MAIVSFIKGVGKTIVRAVEFIKDRTKRGEDKVKNIIEKGVSKISKDTSFMSADEKADLFNESYKRNTDGMSEDSARRIREEDQESFIEDMKVINDIKDDVRGNIVSILLASFTAAAVASVAIVATSVNGRGRMNAVIRESTDRTVAWNNARQ